MITKKEILNFSGKYGVPATTIDKDYVLGNVLMGIYSNLYFKEKLVFKGGTCLKKCYFEDYRFSEDLDFTVLDSIDKKKIISNLSDILKKVHSVTNIVFDKIKIDDQKYQNTLMGYNVIIPFWGANHSKNKNPVNSKNWPAIKIDITIHEKIFFAVQQRNLIYSYSDKSQDILINVYSIEEIISEKLRSLLQRKYSAPRDYYDLWYLTQNTYNWDNISKAFYMKCELKEINFNSIDDFFVSEKLISCRNQWENSLGNHLKNLPDFENVINDLRNNILLKK